MADRYWVGGAASWNSTAGTKWALTSGGTGGEPVPTASDDVFFDAASGAVTVTVTTPTPVCRNLDCTGFTGTLFFSSIGLNLYGSLTLSSSMTFLPAVNGWVFNATSGSHTITTAGKTLPPITIGSAVSTATHTLGDAFTSSSSITVSFGTLTTNNFNVTATSLISTSSNTRAINLGSSTVALSGSGSVVQFAVTTGMTFNAGTSTIVLSSATSPNLSVEATGLTFYNVSFTGANATQQQVSGANTFNNLSVTGRSSAGIKPFIVDSNQTINGTLTLSAGTDATMRTFVRSDTVGTARTLTCAAVASLTDIDFRDITIAGAAAPVSGTRLGDCKGNSGITFPAAKTVYWVISLSNNWSGTNVWATTSGGSGAVNNFPLAQDTAVIDNAGLSSGNTITINAAYNIGTINMSARTGNTMTLATGTTTPAIYGNWINGTGTTLTGTGSINFFGRGSQTVTSAGVTFTQGITVNSPGGSLTLLDAFLSNRSNVGALAISAGTFDANNYNVTLTGSGSAVSSSTTTARTIAIGSGTWTLSGVTAWNMSSSINLTVTGTGTISLISASSKNFVGRGIQTYPTLNQGGTGALRVLGSNKFANITNTAIGRVEFDPGETNIFSAFNLNGVSGNLLQLGANTAAQTTLQKSSAWLMGANSTDAGNNTGLSFTAGGGIDYLSVSYINGTVVSPTIDAFIIERITAVEDSNPAGSIYNAILPVETAQGSDSIIGAYLWNLIDDAQNANWQDVSTAQNPGWTGIDDSQNPNWQNVNT